MIRASIGCGWAVCRCFEQNLDHPHVGMALQEMRREAVPERVIAISNSRLIKTDGKSVTFKVKNYRVEGRARYTTMTLDVAEFIRRFLIHMLPKGFHRIRHYGFLASATKAANLASAREKLDAALPDATTSHTATADADASQRCPCCGGRMHIIETFARGKTAHHHASPTPAVIRIDTS
jgi:Putative transposase